MANTIDDGSQYEAATPITPEAVDDGSQYEMAAPVPISEPTTWDKVKGVGGKIWDAVSVPSDLITFQENQFDPQPIADLKRGVRQGASMNFGDELQGVQDAVVEGGKRLFTADFKDYGDKLLEAYRSGRDDERGKNTVAEERSPILYGGGQIAGGVATGLATGGLGPQAAVGGLGKQVAFNAARGAVEGAVGGLGNSNADLTQGEFGQAAVDTAMGAGLGGGAGAGGTLVGAALGKVATGAQKFLKDTAKKYALKATGFIQSDLNKLKRGQQDYVAETLLSRFVPKGSLAEFLSNLDEFTEDKAIKYGFKSLDEVKQIMDNPEGNAAFFEKPIVTAFASPSKNIERISAAKDYLGESLDRTVTTTDNIADNLGQDLPGGWFNTERALKRIDEELLQGKPTDTESMEYIKKLMGKGYTQDQAELALQKAAPYKVSGRFNTEEFPEMEKYGRRLNKVLEDYNGKELPIAKANEVKKQLQAGANWNPTRTNDELKVSGANKDASRIFREEVESGVESAGKMFEDIYSSEQSNALRLRIADVRKSLEDKGLPDDQINAVIKQYSDELEKSIKVQQFLEGYDFKNLKNYNKRYGALADVDPVVNKQLNRIAGNASPGLIDSVIGGGAGATAGGIAGGLVAGPAGAVLGAATSSYVGAKTANVIRRNAPALVAGTANRLSGMNLVKQLAKTNPQALGKWGGVLASAAARGDAALQVTHYTLGNSDPEYQQKLKDLQDGNSNKGQNDLDL